MKIGIYEKAINKKFNWSEKIDIAQQAGFDFIEFSVDESDARMQRLDWDQAQINELQKLLIAKDFYFNSMALSGLRKYPYGSNDERTRKQAIALTKKAIVFAKKLGIRNIQLAGYDVYYEPSSNKTRVNFIKSVQEVIQVANEHSVMLSFEIMDTAFMGTIKNYYHILQDIKSPWLKLYPDLGNLWQWADDIGAELRLGKDDLVGLHFKDTRPGLFRNVPFGQGTVDFTKIFQVLQEINYTGPFVIEMWSTNHSEETQAENVAKLKQALEFFHKKGQNV